MSCCLALGASPGASLPNPGGADPVDSVIDLDGGFYWQPATEHWPLPQGEIKLWH
jgi:hypothetical protein